MSAHADTMIKYTGDKREREGETRSWKSTSFRENKFKSVVYGSGTAKCLCEANFAGIYHHCISNKTLVNYSSN